MAEVAILGAGHGGCAAAADLTSRGHHVRVEGLGLVDFLREPPCSGGPGEGRPPS